MLKDREQKAKALQFAVASRWFPQLEVEVGAGPSVAEKAAIVTDLDVLASVPDQFTGYRPVVFDCKTKGTESAVNRALWLVGVMQRMQSQQGFCILKNKLIDIDHRLMAGKHGVILLSEDEFDVYTRVTALHPFVEGSNTENMSSWDRFNSISSRFPKLRDSLVFIRTGYWMIESAAESCRKSLAMLRGIHRELDPAQPAHVSLFIDTCSLFARSLAIVVCHVFKAYLHPSSQADLSEALLVMLYGGREAYAYRNELFKLAKSRNGDASTPDLSLPEWDRFLNLVRQLLDAPLAIQRTPLILREVAFAILNEDHEMVFARGLCAEIPQAARFALLIPGYLAKACQLPPEFSSMAENILIALQPVK